MASEAVRNIRTVKSFANEDMEAKRYYEKLVELYHLQQRGQMIEPVLKNFEKVVSKVAKSECFLKISEK